MIGFGSVLIGLAVGLSGDRTTFDKKRASLKKLELERERLREAWRDRMWKISGDEETFDRERAAYRARDEELDQKANDLDHELRAMARKLKIRFEGLDKYLGPNADLDQIHDEYCDRLGNAYNEMYDLDWLIQHGPVHNMSPCEIRFRQSYRRTKDAIEDLRHVTNHPKFPLLINKMGRAGRQSPRCEEGGDLDYVVVTLREYEELFRDFNCSMIWTGDHAK